MIIHQASFGPLKGHAFIRGSSPALENLFREVAWLTDLPQTAPAGVAWKPFFRLVSFDGFLILVYTHSAKNTSRSGNVESRAAFIPMDSISEAHDLHSIANVLRQGIRDGSEIHPINLPENSPNKVSKPNALTIALAEGLASNSVRPHVVIDQEELAESMFDLWILAPHEFRRQLTFGLSFGPEDVRDLSVVSTPSSLATKWDAAQIISRQESRSLSEVAQVILGDSESPQIRTFAADFGLILDSAKSISIALLAHKLTRSMRTASDALTLLRILNEKASTDQIVEAKKIEIIQLLISYFSSWTIADVLSMRNIKLDNANARSNLSNQLATWARNFPDSVSVEEILEIYRSWASRKPMAFWTDAIGIGLKASIEDGKNKKQLVGAFWALIVENLHYFPPMISLVSILKDPQLEILALVPDSIGTEIADKLINEFIKLGWWRTIGVLIARSRTGPDTLKAALSLNPGRSKRTLLQHALSQIQVEDLVAIAIKSQDEDAIYVAAESVSKSKQILVNFDWRNHYWVQLANIAISKNSQFIDLLSDTDRGIAAVVAARLVDRPIWELIAKSRLANILRLSTRSQAWPLIPEDILPKILSATTDAWLEQFEESQETKIDVETPLKEAIFERVSAPGFYFDTFSRDPSLLLKYFRVFGISSETAIRELIRTLRESDFILTDQISKYLGEAIRTNGWGAAANDVRYIFGSRPDFRPMMKECAPLLWLVDQVWVSFQLGISVSLTADEAWSVIENEVTTLYPGGPFDREIWSRSGGKNEDVNADGSGRESWHRCVRELRNGKRPGVIALLNCMILDYPFNDTLKQLAKHSNWGQ